jgi:hypothetical protein
MGRVFVGAAVLVTAFVIFMLALNLNRYAYVKQQTVIRMGSGR